MAKIEHNKEELQAQAATLHSEIAEYETKIKQLSEAKAAKAKELRRVIGILNTISIKEMGA